MATLCTTIIFGAIVGWFASLITGKKDTGCITNIVIGILGSVVGTFILQTINITNRPVIIGFDCASLFIGIFGAVILLTIFNLISKK